MRPTLTEIINGVSNTLSNRATSMAMNTGDNENYYEFALTNTILGFALNQVDHEFSRLMKQNIAMIDLLRDASTALQSVNHPEAAKLAEIADKSQDSINDFPPLSILREKHVLLKEGLEKFILIHAAMPEGGSPALQTVRKNIRRFLKECVELEIKGVMQSLSSFFG